MRGTFGEIVLYFKALLRIFLKVLFLLNSSIYQMIHPFHLKRQ